MESFKIINYNLFAQAKLSILVIAQKIFINDKKFKIFEILYVNLRDFKGQEGAHWGPQTPPFCTKNGFKAFWMILRQSLPTRPS